MMDKQQKMTRKELHDLLDDNLNGLKNVPFGIMQIMVADAAEKDTEVLISGRNIDPRVVLFAVLQEYVKEGGERYAMERLNEVLGKLFAGSAAGGGVIMGTPSDLRQKLDQALKALQSGQPVCDGEGDCDHGHEDDDEEDDSPAVPPQRPTRV